MGTSLPPLNALRAFEASARHLSFTKAAAELGVTPGAVSHQIKALEEILGVRLFRRLTRALKLTEAGRRALPVMSEGFQRLGEAVELLRADDAEGELKVATPTTFAAKWLVPRLHHFQARHPEISVRIDAANTMVDLQSGEADIAVRYGSGIYPKLRVEPLIGGEFIAPLCSPALCEGPEGLKKPEDLEHHTLIHLEIEQLNFGWPTWEMWLKAAGVDHVCASRGPVFAQHDLAINAAIAGQGVVLASVLFMEPDIAAGRLVIPFDLGSGTKFQSDFQYYLVTAHEAVRRPKVAAFREWLLEEAGTLKSD